MVVKKKHSLPFFLQPHSPLSQAKLSQAKLFHTRISKSRNVTRQGQEQRLVSSCHSSHVLLWLIKVILINTLLECTNLSQFNLI